MSNIKTLAVRDTQAHPVVPAAEELAAIAEEMKDMGRVAFGRIKMPSGNMKAFNVIEPGADEDEAVPETQPIDCVILYSNRVNARFAGAYDGADQPPLCASMDGETGLDAETGERVRCESCPHNQFGSGENGGKSCKNSRRLYLLRVGGEPDLFPMAFQIPATALSSYDNYRTKLIMGRKRVQNVITRIGLKQAKSRGGISYFVPTFEAVEALSASDAAQVKQYAEGFSAAFHRATESAEAPVAGAREIVDSEPLPF